MKNGVKDGGKHPGFIAGLALSAFAAFPACAQQGDTAELAKKTQNPIASLVSVPFQLNYDRGIGPEKEGDRYLLNMQPVIPFSLDAEWNLISRTILPVLSQQGALPGAADESGLGDITQSLFFSPKQATASGWIWGAGPVFLLPTASDDALGGKKWGIGPTAVVLKQAHGWTYGALANHLWSVAGDDCRRDVNATYVQPFLTYTTRTFTSFSINSESTYDWEAKEWSVPVNLAVSQLLRVGQQPLSLQGGLRYWADSPRNGPEGWGFRFAVTLLFPN